MRAPSDALLIDDEQKPYLPATAELKSGMTPKIVLPLYLKRAYNVFEVVIMLMRKLPSRNLATIVSAAGVSRVCRLKSATSAKCRQSIGSRTPEGFAQMHAASEAALFVSASAFILSRNNGSTAPAMPSMPDIIYACLISSNSFYNTLIMLALMILR